MVIRVMYWLHTIAQSEGTENAEVPQDRVPESWNSANETQGSTYASPSSPSSESEPSRLPLLLDLLLRSESLLALLRLGAGDNDPPLLSSPDSSSEPASAKSSSSRSAMTYQTKTLMAVSIYDGWIASRRIS